MARAGIPSFLLDVTDDDSLQLIEAEFGITGFAVIIKIYQKIFREQGYFCSWSEEVMLLFARKIGVGGNIVSEITKAALKRGIFDKQLYEKYTILTSAWVQKKYFSVAQRRTTLEIESKYLLVPYTQKKSVDKKQEIADKNSKIARSFATTERNGTEGNITEGNITEHNITERNETNAAAAIQEHFVFRFGRDADRTFQKTVIKMLSDGMTQAAIIGAIDYAVSKKPENPESYITARLKLGGAMPGKSSAPPDGADEPLQNWEKDWLRQVKAAQTLRTETES